MATQPDFLPMAFAANGDKNTIPNTATSSASWDDGFPIITATPLGAGGVAPDRKDFNGIFNALSAQLVYMQTGGVWAYSATLDYDTPAIVFDSTDDNLYFCVGANGPSGTVIAPNADATGQYWQRVPWGDITWLNEAVPTRTGDDTFTVTGDQTAKYPMGKYLRINGDDTYLCRVLGAPVAIGGITTITVWFDVKTTLPASITKLERSRQSPQADARGVALVTTTQYTEDQITKLLQSHCYSSVTIKGA